MRHIKLMAVSLLLGALACGGREDSGSVAQTPPRSLLELERQQAESPLKAVGRQYDFGSIPIDGGNVETVFQVSNKGSAPVRLVAVYTSCGCTTAVLEFANGGEAGPFGMPGHKSVETELDRTLAAGEDLAVRVNFDPAAHGPGGLGNVTRVVTLHTADGETTELTITASVVRA